MTVATRGFKTLPSGRQVFETGKVMVGLLAARKPDPMSTDAERFQRDALAARTSHVVGGSLSLERAACRRTRAVRGAYDEAFCDVHTAPVRVKLDTGLLAAAGRLVAQLMRGAR